MGRAVKVFYSRNKSFCDHSMPEVFEQDARNLPCPYLQRDLRLSKRLRAHYGHNEGVREA